MGLFDFLNKKPITSINDILKVNLLELPDKRFKAYGLIRCEKSRDFYYFELILNYLEFGIFEKIEIHQYLEGDKTISFRSTKLLELKLDKVRKIVDTLFSLYGRDIYENGSFSDKDKNEFYGHHPRYLRSWDKPESQFSNISIDVNREDNEFSLDIRTNYLE